MQTNEKTAVRVYEATYKTPGYNFAVSVPGAQHTQWFDKRADAEKFIVDHGFKVHVDVPSVTITAAELQALREVAEAAKPIVAAYDDTERESCWQIKELCSALAALDKVQAGGVK